MKQHDFVGQNVMFGENIFTAEYVRFEYLKENHYILS